MRTKGLITFDSIGSYHKALDLPKPQHPLVSILKFKGTKMNPYFLENKFIYDFYTISIKKNIKGTIRYGRQNYDFSEGIMSMSDLLRMSTGQNTQQHIHTWVIERAKEKLATTSLTVNEIAIQLGFEYPQYFSRLFKTKTTLTPKEFRNSFD